MLTKGSGSGQDSPEFDSYNLHIIFQSIIDSCYSGYTEIGVPKLDSVEFTRPSGKVYII